MKKLIVFDLDGTLAPSKSSMDAEMASLLDNLLKVARVAVISGGDWPQFQKQLIGQLPQDDKLEKLSVLPTCGTKFFRYNGTWEKVYSEDLTQEERTRIIEGFKTAMAEAKVTPEKTWGEIVEDRGTQVTFSALGQEAPLEEKEKWDPDHEKRKKLKTILDPLLPGFAINMGGSTSIDVTKEGIDKAYGIKKLEEILEIKIEEMIFIGDAIFPGGNDYPAQQAGVRSIKVKNPEDTKKVVDTIIACLEL